MNFKKPFALVTAAAMTLSGTAISPVVSFAGEDAASEYHAVLEAALDESLENFGNSYDAALSRISAFHQNGEHAEISLTLGNSAIALIRLMGIDVSWLNDIVVSIDEKLTDTAASAVLGLSMNDKQLLTLNVPVDLKTLTTYIQIPELSDKYLAIPVSGNQADIDAASQIIKIANDMEALFPDKTSLISIIDRYSKILINGIHNVTSQPTRMFTGEFEQDCTVYSISFSQKDALAIAKDFLTTAQSDEELKNLLISTVNAMIPNSEINGEQVYLTLQNNIQNSLAELKEVTDISDEAVLTADITVDADQRIAGILLYADEQPVFSYQNATHNNLLSTAIEIRDGSNTIGFYGSGEIKDDILNGTYHIAMTLEDQSINILDIDIADYYNNFETQEGHAVVTLKLDPGILDIAADSIDSENAGNILIVSNMLSSYAVVLSEDTNKDEISISMTLKNDQQDFVTIGEVIRYSTDIVASIPGPSDNVIDSSVSDGIDEFLNSINPDTLLSILSDAGIPDEYLAILTGESIAE